MSFSSMEWVHVVIIIMVKLLLSKSQPETNSKVEDSAKFKCTAEEGSHISDRLRMFLHIDKMKVSCNLYIINHLDTGDLSILSPLYTSMGLIPSIEIFNRTSLMSFKFEKNLVKDMAAWHLEIPREKIIMATDVFPGDEWHVKLKVHYGSRLFSTEGTLLDVVREPLLQWRIGVEVEAYEVFPVLQIAYTLIIASRLCASDVGIIAPLLSGHETPNAGMYLLVTRSGFTSGNDRWYDVKPILCAILKGACDHIFLKNLAFTNRHLSLLTTHGLFVSQNLLQVEKNSKPARQLQYYPAKVLSTRFTFSLNADHQNMYLWKTDQCFTDNTVNQEDFMTITMSAMAPNIKRVHTCFYAASPFQTWHTCSPSDDNYIPDIITTVWDRQRNTLIILSYLAYSPKSQAKLTVQRFNEDFTLRKERAFPEFYFPDKSFLPNGMFMYPSTYSLYVFGSQVWYSSDGGISFQLLFKLKYDYVEKILTCPYNQAVIFVTIRQSVYYTRLGLSRYALLSIPRGTMSTLYCDHLGILTNIKVNGKSVTRLKGEIIDLQTLIQDDDAGFSRPLALQFLTDKKVMFFEHISWIEHEAGSKPLFSDVHVGKMLILKLGGGAEITEVYQEHSKSQFLAVAIANILWSFYAEPFRRRLFLNKLLIVKRGKIYHLELLDADYGFEADDFENTLVVPGYSSFLIFRVNSSNLVLAYATMPMLTSYYTLIEEGKWFLYDFSSRNGTWSIYENLCSTWTEDSNNAYLNPFIHLDLNDTLNFHFKISSTRTGAQVFKVTIGNPHLLQIESESKWDESGVSILDLVITSNFNQRGYTTILVTIPEASLLCPITSFAIIVQCSCPAGKMIVYETPTFIKKEDWLHYNEKNEGHEKAILKNLPVNYRPPSILGINLPVSENFYNADPSKPKFRNFYELSKKTGHYKQCENKKSRKECGCTEAMKLSSLIQYSDCREKVYRVTYPVKDFLLKLYLKKSNQVLQQLSAPYFVLISELNNRTNWEATSTKINPSFDKLRKYFVMSTDMHNPDGLSISLFGSELYHFRITVISGVSFCNLVEEFQIYVDDPPMAYPFHYLVSMITAIGLGAFIMFYFILQHYWSKFNIKSPCWKLKIHPLPGSKLIKFNK